MDYSSLQSKILSEAETALKSVPEQEVLRCIDYISGARKIFVYGLGRERLMLKAFAMRLVHLGLDVHIVGDVTTPRIQEGDLFITSSGTGYLSTVEALLKIVRKSNASVCYFTANADSSMASYADQTIVIEAQTMKDKMEERTSIQPMGAVFEQGQLFLFELMIVLLKEKIGINPEEMEQFHTILE